MKKAIVQIIVGFCSLICVHHSAFADVFFKNDPCNFVKTDIIEDRIKFSSCRSNRCEKLPDATSNEQPTAITCQALVILPISDLIYNDRCFNFSRTVKAVTAAILGTAISAFLSVTNEMEEEGRTDEAFTAMAIGGLVGTIMDLSRSNRETFYSKDLFTDSDFFTKRRLKFDEFVYIVTTDFRDQSRRCNMFNNAEFIENAPLEQIDLAVEAVRTDMLDYRSYKSAKKQLTTEE